MEAVHRGVIDGGGLLLFGLVFFFCWFLL